MNIFNGIKLLSSKLLNNSKNIIVVIVVIIIIAMNIASFAMISYQDNSFTSLISVIENQNKILADNNLSMFRNNQRLTLVIDRLLKIGAIK